MTVNSYQCPSCLTLKHSASKRKEIECDFCEGQAQLITHKQEGEQEE